MKVVRQVDIGARVRRGPDWKWNVQDTWDIKDEVVPNATGLGTITGESMNGWAVVRWDSGATRFNYRVGQNEQFDLVYAEEDNSFLRILEL